MNIFTTVIVRPVAKSIEVWTDNTLREKQVMEASMKAPISNSNPATTVTGPGAQSSRRFFFFFRLWGAYPYSWQVI